MASGTSAIDELQAIEDYSRKIVHLEEADILQRVCMQFRRLDVAPRQNDVPHSNKNKNHSSVPAVAGIVEPSLPAGANIVSLPGGGPRLDVSNSCGVCCRGREIAQGVCSHATEAAESTLRFQQFREYHDEMTSRLRNASNRIRSTHLQYVARPGPNLAPPTAV